MTQGDDKFPDGLPALRNELNIFPAGHLKSGSPCWNIYDPVAHNYFQIGWTELEVVSSWQEGMSIEDFSVYMIDKSGGIISPEKTKEIILFLVDHNLTSQVQDRRQEMPLMRKLFQPFMYKRVPLIRPAAFFEKVAAHSSIIHKGHVLAFMALGIILSILIVLSNLNEYFYTFDYLFQPMGLVYLFFAMLLVKVVHEIGHATVAARNGCRVTNMGVAFLFLWPVLYTDVTDSWRIDKKHKKIAIDLAGVSSEIILAICATFLWWVLEGGALKTIAFLLSSTTWIFSLLINLNPLMKFDGYYAMSDYLEIPNLSTRANRYLSYRFRQSFFNVALPVQEVPPINLRKFFVSYGVASQLYRIFVFSLLAIGFSYSLPKILAYPLIAGFAWFMIVSPLVSQLSFLWQGRKQLSMKKTLKISTLFILPLLVILFMPIRQGVTGPALVRHVPHALIYAPSTAKIDQVYIKEGDNVNPGQILVRLSSFDLDQKLKIAEAKLDELNSQLANIGIAGQSTSFRQVLSSGRKQIMSEISAIKLKQDKLLVRAPFEGKVTSLSPVFDNSLAVAEDEVLMHLVGRQSVMLTAYVGDEIQGYLTGSKMTDIDISFYDTRFNAYKMKADITVAPVKSLEDAELASIYGGDIAVREDASGNLMPEKALYKVTVQLNTNKSIADERLQIGKVSLSMARQSFASEAYNAIRIWLLTL